MQVWLISCILFVFLALIEYFIVLFGIRYDKHWRTAKTITKVMASGMSNNETQVSVNTRSSSQKHILCILQQKKPSDAEFSSTKEWFRAISPSIPKFKQNYTGE